MEPLLYLDENNQDDFQGRLLYHHVNELDKPRYQSIL